MYTLVSVFSTKQFVLRANVALAKVEGSRISINEHRMLSSDVLGLVKDYYSEEVLTADTNILESPTSYDELGDWSRWIVQKEKIVNSKKWYEMNPSDLKYCISTY